MKLYIRMLSLCSAFLFLCACHTDVPESVPEPTASAVQEEIPSYELSETTASQTEIVRREGAVSERLAALGNAEQMHIFDECGISVGDAETYAEEIARTYQIHTAVVVTDQLDGKSADVFAEECYEILYGKGTSGFLILINNDTGEDTVYTSGVCRLYLTEDAITFAIAQSTESLVTGEYADAVHRLLELGTYCPQYIYDRCELLDREQTDTVAEMAAAFPEAFHAVWIVQDVPEGMDLQAYAQNRLDTLDADSLLLISMTEERCAAVYAAGYAGQSDAELTEILQETESYPVMTTITAYYEAIQ